MAGPVSNPLVPPNMAANNPAAKAHHTFRPPGPVPTQFRSPWPSAGPRQTPRSLPRHQYADRPPHSQCGQDKCQASSGSGQFGSNVTLEFDGLIDWRLAQSDNAPHRQLVADHGPRPLHGHGPFAAKSWPPSGPPGFGGGLTLAGPNFWRRTSIRLSINRQSVGIFTERRHDAGRSFPNWAGQLAMWT